MTSKNNNAIPLVGFFRTALIVLGVLGTIIAIGGFLLIRWSGRQHETAAEIPVTPELVASFRNAGFPITVQRAFEASSHGGWHGDGTRAAIYKFPTNEAPALVQALKQKYVGFTWTACYARSATIFELRRLIPPELLPDMNSLLLTGRAADGNPTHEYLVDDAQGVFYEITSTF